MIRLSMLVPLAVLMVSDWKSRTVGAVWLVLLFVSALATSASHHGLRMAATFTALNLALLIAIGAVLLVYSRLRAKRLREMLGAGDAFFFAAITPVLPPEGYLRLCIVLLLSALVLWLMLRKRLSPPNIPLVTFCGVPFAAVVIIMTILPELWTV